MLKLFKNAKLVLKNEIVEGSIAVSNGKISDISTSEKQSYDEAIDVKGKYLLAGFIDVHVHGGGGADFMDGDVLSFENAVNTHLSHGTTSICPTTMSAEFSDVLKVMDVYREVIKRGNVKANLCGLHLEGPFISPKMCGAQRLDLIIPPSEEIIETLVKNTDVVSRISCAPEVDNVLYMAKRLLPYGVQFSMGHTNATYEQAETATEVGFTSVTHMYSATSGFHKVNQKVHVGVTQAGYGIEELFVELIGDGCHVPKELLRLVSKVKGYEKVCLVTDAMRAAGTDVKESYLGSISPENRVIIDDGVAKLPDKSFFAGSIGTMDRALRFAVEKANIPIWAASAMVSLAPANLLGIQNDKGSIEIGKDADIVIMDNDLNVDSVFIKGKKVC